ncbi:hypothetical protein DPEC_G00295400 [Dallia pectoralis]|uniref:Uncharacterized protein n=1 Tax=Dallia pectoralis TaxID=75939 RepID=A0ACC2FIH7_DALPE|nr:hypothetical protein DPEC_G00295400 [Dallia pectoralis]
MGKDVPEFVAACAACARARRHGKKGATVSLSSGFHPQSNGQTEQANQDLETALRCMVADNPTTWSKSLMCVEYAHNSLPSSATGLSPFESSLGYQQPLFPDQEPKVGVPSAQAFVRRCRRSWNKACASLMTFAKDLGTLPEKGQANRRRTPAPRYRAGQMVECSTPGQGFPVPGELGGLWA